jgi:23S rRNA pseudouridine2605 synthase
MGRLSDEQMQKLTTGVDLEDGPAKCESVADGGGEEEGANHWYHVVLKEGRNREVRRLFEALGLTVSRLIRTRYGTLSMPSVMKRADTLELEPAEVAAVMDSAGLKAQGGPPGQQRPGGGKNNRGRHQNGRPKGRKDSQDKASKASRDSRDSPAHRDSRANRGSPVSMDSSATKVSSGITANRDGKDNLDRRANLSSQAQIRLRSRSSRAMSRRDRRRSRGSVPKASTAVGRAAKEDHGRKDSWARAAVNAKAGAKGSRRARRVRAPTSTRNSR